MDIVLGLSHILGIDLPENFRQPFSSETIQEFWQKWHITLGGWLKDYIFYPLLRSAFIVKLSSRLKDRYGKKKAKNTVTYLSMAVLWLCAGLWHGGAWKYIWGTGILQCIYIIIGEILRPVFEKLWKKAGIDRGTTLLRIIRRVRTFVLISFAFLYFNAGSLMTGNAMIGSMFSGWSIKAFSAGGLTATGLEVKDQIILVVSLCVLTVMSHVREKKDEKIDISGMNPILRWSVLYALLFAVMIFGIYGPGYNAAEFIYQGF